jgi:hypothetical protein
VNFDYIILLSNNTISNQKRLFDKYAGMFPNFNSFQQVYNQLTNDYDSIIITQKINLGNFLEKVKYFKIQLGGQFMVEPMDIDDQKYIKENNIDDQNYIEKNNIRNIRNIDEQNNIGDIGDIGGIDDNKYIEKNNFDYNTKKIELIKFVL